MVVVVVVAVTVAVMQLLNHRIRSVFGAASRITFECVSKMSKLNKKKQRSDYFFLKLEHFN